MEGINGGDSLSPAIVNHFQQRSAPTVATKGLSRYADQIRGSAARWAKGLSSRNAWP